MDMSLTVLNVAFPFCAVSADPVGGAEQVLSHIDRALVAAGHRSLVLAPEGSECAGTLITIPRPQAVITAPRRAARHAEVLQRICAILEQQPIDLLHFHGMDFDNYLPPVSPPVLVTLHLPLAWYSSSALHPQRADVWLQTVSRSQLRSAEPSLQLLPPLENGVATDGFPRISKRGFALVLSRICPEKGVTQAMHAATLAGSDLLIAGEVSPWQEHLDYFRGEVLPRLHERQRFIGPVAGARKRRLLAAARCVLIPSLVAETSSLVAMEALAAGTPVIAYDNGALPDIVDHGRTGFIVHGPIEMAQAMRHVDEISPEVCRRVAHERFSLQPSMQRYLELYQELLALTLPAGNLRPTAARRRMTHRAALSPEPRSRCDRVRRPLLDPPLSSSSSSSSD
ncbi:MAG: glycosyltransferase [Sinobacteraceae bacterium]|nr:glycosyltransferase [Nevskiaceae bacterium]